MLYSTFQGIALEFVTSKGQEETWRMRLPADVVASDVTISVEWTGTGNGQSPATLTLGPAGWTLDTAFETRASAAITSDAHRPSLGSSTSFTDVTFVFFKRTSAAFTVTLAGVVDGRNVSIERTSS